MELSAKMLELVNAAIDGMSYPTKPAGLYEPVRYVLSIGGKRIRPVFLLLSYGLYRKDIDKVMNAALGLETYHNYTLLHDDLMDRANMRRGMPTVHKKWNNNTAILSGDTMLVLACKLISSVQPELLSPVINLFIRTALQIGEGQQYDLNFESRSDVTEEEYIEMIRLKTSVLVACAVKMGAVLGGASATDAETLYDFGEKVGLAFQLQDDYLDVYGNAAVFGKRIGGDILCNKKTYPLITAYHNADDNLKKELDSWISRPAYDETEKIRAVTNVYNQLGIDKLCVERINQYFEEARQCLGRVGLPKETKQPLWDFAAGLMNRKY